MVFVEAMYHYIKATPHKTFRLSKIPSKKQKERTDISVVLKMFTSIDIILLIFKIVKLKEKE